MNNKVKFGLKNVHYAKAVIDTESHTATYAKPVAWPGAVNLNLDPEGETTNFRADNINYWVGTSNNGYSGDYENATCPDSFKKDILGYIEDKNGVLIEDADAPTVPFALLFEFDGDVKATRHVLYNCTASRGAVSGATTEEQKEPTTETSTITASSIFNAALNKEIIKASTTPDSDANAYDNWYKDVYTPEPVDVSE